MSYMQHLVTKDVVYIFNCYELCLQTAMHEATCKAFIDAMDARYEENRMAQAQLRGEIAQLKTTLDAERTQKLDESHSVINS